MGISSFNTKEECKSYMRDYRDSIRAYYRSYSEKYRRKNGYYNEENSKNRYPEKQKARSAVHRALKKGTLIRLKCLVCNFPKTEAHHENYSKPLEVIWLCKQHHVEADKKLR